MFWPEHIALQLLLFRYNINHFVNWVFLLTNSQNANSRNLNQNSTYSEFSYHGLPVKINNFISARAIITNTNYENFFASIFFFVLNRIWWYPKNFAFCGIFNFIGSRIVHYILLFLQLTVKKRTPMWETVTLCSPNPQRDAMCNAVSPRSLAALMFNVLTPWS